MVTYPVAHVLDVVGPLEVPTGAKYFLPEGTAPYEVTIVAHMPGPVSTTSGLAIMDDTEIDTLIVSGGHGTARALEDLTLMAYVCAAAPRSPTRRLDLHRRDDPRRNRPARPPPRHHALVVVPDPRNPPSERDR